MHLVLLLATAALLSGCRAASVRKELPLLTDIENNIVTNGLQTKVSEKRFVSIMQRPDASYAHRQGDVLHLKCEALGSPAPSVRWFKNDAPVFEYDMESNELVDSNPESLARISSTLLVTRSSGRDSYSCLVTAGAKIARASTMVYSIDGSTDLSERSKLYPLVPEVVGWYRLYFDTIGNDVVLPCRVKGHPRPHVTWKNKGQLVKNHPRMKVLRSGELLISSLRWSDMGEFSCHATNTFGSSSISTFLYPAKAR